MAQNLKKLNLGSNEFLITPDWESVQNKPPIEKLTETKGEGQESETVGVVVNGTIAFKIKNEEPPYKIPRIFTVQQLPGEDEYNNYQIGDIFILIENPAASVSEEGEV